MRQGVGYKPKHQARYKHEDKACKTAHSMGSARSAAGLIPWLIGGSMTDQVSLKRLILY